MLVVRDEKTGEISVVAGLNADGTPKRTPAKAENAQSFLQFDRHGDVLDNFFKNFFRQCKEPSRFGFYRIAADQAENLLEVMKATAERPPKRTRSCSPLTRWTPPTMRRRCRKRWQHNRQRNKNLKNRKTWNNGKNSNRTNPNRCRANGATSPSTRAKSTGRSWRTDGA